MWRYRYVVLVVALLSAVAGYVYQSSKPPLYEAATQIELRNPYAMTLFRNELGTAFTDVERYLTSQAAMVTSPPVMARASANSWAGAAAGRRRSGRASRPRARRRSSS